MVEIVSQYWEVLKLKWNKIFKYMWFTFILYNIKIGKVLTKKIFKITFFINKVFIFTTRWVVRQDKWMKNIQDLTKIKGTYMSKDLINFNRFNKRMLLNLLIIITITNKIIWI